MLKVGDVLYGMRIVKTYNGNGREEKPLFNGFEGIVVWNTWDTGDWQVLRTKIDEGEFITEEVGIIDDSKIQVDWNGEKVAEFIRDEVSKILNKVNEEYRKVTTQEVRSKLLEFGIVAPRNMKAMQHISRKNFKALTDKITEYINEQIETAIWPWQNQEYLIAIDDVIASIIQIHDERY